MNKVLSLLVVSSALAVSGASAHAESLPDLVNAQIGDRSVATYDGATSGSDVSIVRQESDQFGNSGRPDVDASASRGNDGSLVHLEYEQIPH
jgi:hypothetical protein